MGGVMLYLLFDRTESESWTAFKYSIAHSMIFYVLCPVLYLVFGRSTVLKNSEYDNLNNVISLENQLVIFLVIFIFFAAYVFAYKIVVKDNSIGYKLSPKYFKGVMWLKISSVLITVLALFSLVFFVYGLGGLKNAIINVALIRSGLFEDVTYVNASSTFFFRFVFWAIIPILLFLSFKKYFNYQDFKSKLIYFYVPIILILFLYLFFAQGRQYIFDLILIFLLTYLISKKVLINWTLLSLVPLVFVMQYGIKSFFNYIAYDSDADLSDFGLFYLFQEYCFPFTSIHYALNYSLDYFYFKDFYYALFGSFLPSGDMLGNEILNFNSRIALANKGTPVSIPAGIISSGLYNYGFIGVVITAIGSGIVLGLVDKYFKKLIKGEVNLTYLYCFLITHTLVMFRTGSVRFYFYDARLFLAVLVIFVCFRISKETDVANSLMQKV